MTNVEWRWKSGWSDPELLARLGKAATLPLNFEGQEKDMTPDNGWSLVESQAIIGCDRPGAPSGDDAFARLKHAVTELGFSDPRIVRGHFDSAMPLLGRPMLLELRPLRVLRYLCPVRIRAVRSEQDEHRTAYGFSIDTLVGHVESGREWFLLSKDHRTGELRFHIKAAWREGEFPNWWSAVGFELMGRRYQRAWHHLAHMRLRELLSQGHLVQHPGGEEMQHTHLRVSRLPVQFFSQRGLSRRLVHVEREVESERGRDWLTTVGFGVLAGMRSMSAPALLSYHFSIAPRTAPEGWGARLPWSKTSGVLGLLAAGEWVADKTPWIPARVSPPALLGRVLTGALTGAAVAAPGQRLSPVRAVVGATAAVVSAFGLYTLRRFATRRLGVPNAVAGLLEDAAAAAIGGKLFASLR
ncbi:DUF1990 family protein [Melittangium boletus]|uniref:DUF1990 domain-containing protein n=1 Tax=Melittangium boletus DSM 14713 TaxID=1294270 RepID=A0A250IKJ0_9BACT|nr:DUF1990 family protein [Melittangium boletus]ATB32279.1 hypothetical protein MEBOL_005756 [Melittangium boletus DSM 14713]